jgi:hypothetical protein
MLIPLSARRKAPGIAQNGAPFFDEVIEAVKRVIGRCEGSFCHNAPPGFRRERHRLSVTDGSRKRCGDAKPTPQATSCSAKDGIAQGAPVLGRFFQGHRLIERHIKPLLFPRVDCAAAEFYRASLQYATSRRGPAFAHGDLDRYAPIEPSSV